MVAGRMALAFILEGIPAIILGIVTIFYLTDWPWQARWLPDDERDWLVNELQTELQAKKKVRDHTITQALCDRRVLMFAAAFFLVLSGALGNIYWIPTFVKRLSGFPTGSNNATNNSSSYWHRWDAD